MSPATNKRDCKAYETLIRHKLATSEELPHKIAKFFKKKTKFKCQICHVERIALANVKKQVICAVADSPQCRRLYSQLLQMRRNKKIRKEKKEFTCIICRAKRESPYDHQKVCSLGDSPACRVKHEKTLWRRQTLKDRALKMKGLEHLGIIYPTNE